MIGARYGDHLNPPPRLPGETFEDWLSACQTAIVLLPERTSVDPRAETVKEPAVRPAQVCALDSCGIVFNPRAATQRCCSRPHREALARAEGRRGKKKRPDRPQTAAHKLAPPAMAATTSQPQAPGDRRCETCGTAFHPRRATHRFCSPACQNAWQRRAPVPCPICGTPFRPIRVGKDKLQQTCSHACGQRLRVRQVTRVPRAPCPICGADVPQYAIRRPDQKIRHRTYCSQACVQAAGLHSVRWPDQLPTITPLGTMLRRWRQRAGLSQNRLAELVEVNVACVNRLESGKQEFVRRVTVTAMAKAIGLDPLETDELLIASDHCPELIAQMPSAQFRALAARLRNTAALLERIQ